MVLPSVTAQIDTNPSNTFTYTCVTDTTWGRLCVEPVGQTRQGLVLWAAQGLVGGDSQE